MIASMDGMTWRQIKEFFAVKILRLSLIFINAIAVVITIVLIIKAKPLLADTSIAVLLFSSDWHPLKGQLRGLNFPKFG
jgi:ABC-type phosphate transport system permease subunit